MYKLKIVENWGLGKVDLLIIYVNDYDICGYGVSLGRVLI